MVDIELDMDMYDEADLDELTAHDLTGMSEDVEYVRKARYEGLRVLCMNMWRLLLASGNDDLVMRITHSDKTPVVVDATKIPEMMREHGIEV